MKLSWALLATLGLAAGTARADVSAFVDATVVDLQSGALHPRMTVVVDGERIASIGPELPVPPGAQRIDAAGGYLIPGLWDMHVHFGQAYDEDGRARFSAMMLANGVTGARIMRGGDDKRAYRREVESGQRLGPELVIGSSFVDGPEPIWPGSLAVADEEGARHAVAQEQAAGADFIKVYTLLPRPAFFALAAEARRRGLPFAGHVPLQVSVAEAADAGMASIEHLTGLLAGCSRLEEETRERQYALSLAMARSQSASSERYLKLNIAALDAYDPAKAAQLLDRLRRAQTWQVPTLTYLRGAVDLAQADARPDPRLAYVPADYVARWREASSLRRHKWAPESFALARRLYAAQQRLVGDLHRAGVPLMAGTDVGNAWLYTGFSLHDELRELVAAGLSPLDALRTATVNPARFLGREASLGSVAAGQRADLVLLGSNPLADISAAADIRGVMVRGRWLSRTVLERMLQQVPVAGAAPG